MQSKLTNHPSIFLKKNHYFLKDQNYVQSSGTKIDMKEIVPDLQNLTIEHTMNHTTQFTFFFCRCQKAGGGFKEMIGWQLFSLVRNSELKPFEVINTLPMAFIAAFATSHIWLFNMICSQSQKRDVFQSVKSTCTDFEDLL